MYLLAHFDIPPAGRADPEAEQIIYIGETKQKLRKRLNQFNRSAFSGKSGHSGGVTYREVFEGHANNLCIAIFPVKQLDEKIRSFFIRYAESKLIWQFCRRWGVPPKCNNK